MGIKKITALENLFLESKNYCLAQAVKEIVGSDTTNKLTMSIDEDARKEIEGISKVTWIKDKVIILEYKKEFSEGCLSLGLDCTDFLNRIEQELSNIEKLL